MPFRKAIDDPVEWNEALLLIFTSFYHFYELSAEHPKTGSTLEDSSYFGDTGKYLSELSSQFERPDEFIQVLLDMLRMFLDPIPLGGLTFSYNPQYIFQSIPDRSFKLGYASFLTDPGELFNSFLQMICVVN